MTTSLIILIVLALFFDFLNGFHDSSNIVATMISSRSLSPKQALFITAVAEFLGPFIFGVAVATTIGHEIVKGEAITSAVIYSALISAIIWNIITWFVGIPSSSSHALVGGILGCVLLQWGPKFIALNGVLKILLTLLISPLLGFVAGYIVMKLTLFFVRGATPKVNKFFKRIQVLTAISLALSHGSNDAQKTMGIITMGLLAGGAIKTFEVPIWVIALSATAIAIGTATGGWRLIKTLGGKIFKIRPIHGFTTQIGSAAVILGASLFGGPVSTTHVVASTIMGSGSAERLSKIRWGVAKNIVTTWVITIPSTGLIATGIYLIIRKYV